MLESVTDGITVTDLNGVITEANGKTAEMHGFASRNELLGKSSFELIASHDHKRAATNMRRTLVEGSVKGIEYTLLRADGSEFPGEISASVVKDSSGNPVGFIAITRDITAHKRLDEALRRSEEKYRSLVEDTRAGISSIDSQGRFTFVNRALCEMTGYSAEELLGRPFTEFLHPDNRAEKLQIFRHSFVSQEPVLDVEFRIVHKRGHTIYMYASPTPIKHDGQMVGANSIITDITERKRAEAQLLAYEKELRSLASELSLAEERERRRIATVVHDRISQTLALCRMKLETLTESAASSGLTEHLEEISILVKQLIRESRSLAFELSSPILYELGLGPAVERLSEQIQERNGIRVNFVDDGKPKPLDEGISVLLYQTVNELLVNITKHAQAHHANVSIMRHEDNLKIVVEDDGIGFEASAINSHGRRGKGFGLFSIRERLRHVGGQLEVKSERGRGTRVALVVPIRRQ